MRTDGFLKKSLGILLALGIALGLLGVFLSGEDKLLVRVGVYPAGGVEEYDAQGISAAPPCRDWEYQYVRVETWGQAVEMLQTGEIDLLGTGRQTPAFFEEFGFWKQYRSEILLFLGMLALVLSALGYALVMRRKNHLILEASARKLQNVSELIDGGAMTLLPEKGFPISYADNGFLKLIGYTRQEYEAEKSLMGVLCVHPGDVERLDQFAAVHCNGDRVEMELRIQNKTRGYLPVLLRGVYSNDGAPQFHCVVVDISASKQILGELEMEKERCRVFFEKSNDIFFEADETGKTLACTAKYRNLFGHTLSELFDSGVQRRELDVHPDDVPETEKIKQKVRQGEKEFALRARIRSKRGEYIWCDVQGNVLSITRRPLRILGKIVDVDAEVKEHQRLTDLSQRDPLTNFYNKKAFQAALDDFLQHPRMQGKPGAVFLVDVDQLERLQDKAVKAVAGALQGVFRTVDVLGRFGAHEFLAFVHSMPDRVVLEKADQICETLRMTFGEGAAAVTISASIGVFVFCGAGLSGEIALCEAEEALRQAKRQGRDQVVVCRNP